MEVKKIAWSVALLLCAAFTVNAQENDAPQVLTSDLALRQVVESNKLTVNFVIVDDDKITKVTIDGEAQSFEPSDTVVLTKEFTFTPGRRIIKVVVEDERGNKRERTYLVAFGVPLEAEQPEQKEEPGLRINYVVELAVENDDNPTQDLSLPFGLTADGEELTGVVDDSEQDDTRQTLKGLISLAAGPWAAFAGFASTTYDKSDNEGLETEVTFLGGAWNPKPGDGFQVGVLVSFVSLGGDDYATQLGFSPGIESTSKDSDGTHRSLWKIDVTNKMFDPAGLEDTVVFAVRWVGNSVDKENQDTSRKVFGVGTDSAGSSESEYNFLSWKANWENRWDSGFRWDIGWGYQYRDYPNEEADIPGLFGDTRLDNIFEFSTGVGWEFTPKISALFNYNYKTDISNETPYVRQITGITVKASF